MEILEHHPHMLLGPEDFAATGSTGTEAGQYP